MNKDNKIDKDNGSRIIKRLAKFQKISEIWLILKLLKILLSTKN